MNEKAREGKSAKQRLVKGADHIVNWLAVLLMLMLAGYAGHGLWYNYGLQHGSFLPEELAVYRPDGEGPTLEDLAGINDDVTGWLMIDGTNIDYPVVQGEDDTHYLNYDVFGEFTLAGSIFLSSQNSKDFSDPYNTVYGHNIDGGAMFADVMEFRKASFFEAHPVGTLWHVDGSADHIDIFAVAEVPANDPTIYGHPGEVTKDRLPAMKDYINNMAMHTRAVSLAEENRILLMTTCEDAESFNRVVLAGLLTPMSEEEIQEAQKETVESTTEKASFGDRLWHRPLWQKALLPILLLLLLYLAWRRHVRKQEEKERKQREEER